MDFAIINHSVSPFHESHQTLFTYLGGVKKPFKIKRCYPYQNIRKLALTGYRRQAIQSAIICLQNDPEDNETRVLLGLMYSWEGEYIEARKQLNKVLNRRPRHYDAILALINVELWSNHPEEAILLARKGLAAHPKDAEITQRLEKSKNALIEYKIHTKNYKQALFLAKQYAKQEPKKFSYELTQARVLLAEKDYYKANKLVKKILTVKPNQADVKELDALISKEDIYRTRFPNSIQVSYQHARSYGLSPWNFSYVQYGRATPYGSLLLRGNLANRFDTKGSQYEIDFYPSITSGTYGYLNYGYSSSLSLFPQHRIGAELFKTLPRAFEASLGMRYLSFQNSKFAFYTGSVAKYIGNYWVSARTYLSPESKGFSASYQFALRKYYDDPLHYVSFYYRIGSTSLFSNNNLEEVNYPCTWGLSVDAQIPLTDTLLISPILGYNNLNRYAAQQDLSRFFAGVSIEKLF